MRIATRVFAVILAGFSAACHDSSLPTENQNRPGNAALQGSVTYRGQPVSGALVMIGTGLSAGKSANTSADGKYTISGLAAGTASVRASKADSGLDSLPKTVTLTSGATIDLDFRLFNAD
jgi:carboxypeptidase family protein